MCKELSIPTLLHAAEETLVSRAINPRSQTYLNIQIIVCFASYLNQRLLLIAKPNPSKQQTIDYYLSFWSQEVRQVCVSEEIPCKKRKWTALFQTPALSAFDASDPTELKIHQD